MDFGHTLRIIRTSMGISLRHLSREVGFSPTYLSHVETGKLQPPSEKRIRKIENVLHIPEGSLLELTNRMDPKVKRYLNELTEVTSFLKAAADAGLSEKDFLDLTEILVKEGREGVRKMLHKKKQKIHIKGSRKPESIQHACPISLSAYLRKELISLDFEGGKKEEVMARAMEKFSRVFPTFNKEEALQALLKREEQASTGIGSGIAIPHLMTDRIDATVMGIFRFPRGIPFDSIDTRPVRLLFILVGPAVHGEAHLKILARIAQLMNHDHFKEKLLAARKANQILNLFAEADERII
ncbi:MAG: PTS sugar transporter subunit IIA [Candidatus Glassbacteria bacterium]